MIVHFEFGEVFLLVVECFVYGLPVVFINDDLRPLFNLVHLLLLLRCHLFQSLDLAHHLALLLLENSHSLHESVDFPYQLLGLAFYLLVLAYLAFDLLIYLEEHLLISLRLFSIDSSYYLFDASMLTTSSSISFEWAM
jgi:hypothetical protein